MAGRANKGGWLRATVAVLGVARPPAPWVYLRSGGRAEAADASRQVWCARVGGGRRGERLLSGACSQAAGRRVDQEARAAGTEPRVRSRHDGGGVVSLPGGWRPSRQRGRAAELRGRRRECDLLDQLLDAVHAGESRALVVRGVAGVGKTALLDYLVEHASGCRVARVAGVEAEMELAYAGLHQLCAPMLGRLQRLPAPCPAGRWAAVS